jgi:opacity protein-like surface antigen
MLKLCLVFFIACCASAFSSYALQPVVTLSGGIATPLGQPSQSLTFANTSFDYQPDNSSAFEPMGGISLGLECPLSKIWAWQFGLGYYQTANTSISGEESQAPLLNPMAVNLWNYNYKVASRQLLFENKFLLNLPKEYHPYLFLGLGAGFNRAYGFGVTPENSGEVATATYSSHNNESFVYMAGMGVDKNLSAHLRLGLGYRVGYLGKYDLGTGTLDTGAGGSVFSLPALKSSPSVSQELLVQLTCLL